MVGFYFITHWLLLTHKFDQVISTPLKTSYDDYFNYSQFKVVAFLTNRVLLDKLQKNLVVAICQLHSMPSMLFSGEEFLT